MKTRLYYSFMVGTAIAMGNMRGNPNSAARPAIITVMDSTSPAPTQASADNRSPALRDQKVEKSATTQSPVALTA